MVADPKISGELFVHRTLIENELGPHEHLAWVGQPRPSRVIKRGWMPIIFACLFLALIFFVLWTRVKDLPGGIHDPELLPNILFFVPFVFAGGYLLTKPFRDISKATHLYYIITTERALILVHGRKTFIHVFDPEEIQHAAIHREEDGSGDIWFSRKGKRARLNGFIGLESIDEVLEHLNAIRTPDTYR